MTPGEFESAMRLTAAALALSVPEDCRGLSAGSFRDGTKSIEECADDWQMDVLISPDGIILGIQEIRAALEGISQFIRKGDRDSLRNMLMEASENRRYILNAQDEEQSQ